MTRTQRRRSAHIPRAVIPGLALLTALPSCGSEVISPADEDAAVASVTVSPAAPVVGVSQTLQLFAEALDEDGNAVAATVMWTAQAPSIATVDASGLVMGMSAGTAGVVAAVGGVADTVEVTVTAGGSNQTTYFEEGFEDLDFAGRGWYDNTSLTLSTAEKRSGNSSLEFRYEQGAILPTFGGAARHLFDGAQSVYVSFWVKYSDNWVGSQQTYHPHDIQILTNEDGQYVGPRDTRLTSYIETVHDGTGILPRLIMQDRLNIDVNNINVDLTGVTEDRAAGGCNGDSDVYPTGCYPLGGGEYGNQKVWEPTDTYISTGTWHFVEVYFQLNTIQNGVGQADGVVRYWLDGAEVLDLGGVLFRTGAHPTMAYNQFILGPYIGDGSPVPQTMWIDDLRVADRR